MQLTSNEQTPGLNPGGTTNNNIMEDIFEEIHNEFILSDDFIKYLKEIDIYSEKSLVD